MSQSLPLLTLSLSLAGTVAACRFVTPAGLQAGADANTLGVARSSGISGERTPVDAIGTAIVETGAAIARGATLKVDATGRAIPWATSGARVAIALETAAAAGDMIEVLLLPNA